VILQKREIQNNTDDQVRDYLVSALNITAELDPPKDLCVSVFTQAVALYSGKQIMVEQAAPTFSPPILGGNGLR
jgi:hypothetical protein